MIAALVLLYEQPTSSLSANQRDGSEQVFTTGIGDKGKYHSNQAMAYSTNLVLYDQTVLTVLP